MRTLLIGLILTAALGGEIVFAQPSPIEVMSDHGDTLVGLNGPDGKPLADGAPVFVVRARFGKPELPKPGTGIGENEYVVQKSVINPGKNEPGQLYMYITSGTVGMDFRSNQVIKGEQIFFRAFATNDTTLPSGTLYSDSPFYTIPYVPAQITGVVLGEWKKIP